MEVECGRGLPRGADKGETKGKRARGKSYHDTVSDVEHHLDNLSMSDNHKITKYVAMVKVPSSTTSTMGCLSGSRMRSLV